ncbi:hypothetical protein D1007_07419 [Hordeum vulgare]|nr:hypothetical protein D1007_07419 [Hordeum vulgare]
MGGSTNLPPGFHFFPSDEELVIHFLRRKAALLPCRPDIVPTLPQNRYDPWELNGKALQAGNQWYFFSQATQSRTSRNGYWNPIGADEAVTSGGSHVGLKKTLVFSIGEPFQATKTNWVMHEYHLLDENGGTSTSGMGRTCVYVHHVDKDAFLKGNIDLDPDELDMVFDLCPSYGELLEQVRKDLNWMDPSDVVEFDGRHNVGFGMHIHWKTMRVNAEQRWLAYKDTVPNLLDLNRVASSIVEAIPAPINEEANTEPLSCVDEANEDVNIEHEPLVEANDEHDDDENDGNVLQDNNLGDLDKYNLQETMDHSIPYSCGYASESDDEGPDEEVDEEGFTAKETEAFTKVLKRDHRTPLFEDLSLADEAVVDGGEGILFGVRPPSHRDTHGKNIILPGSKFETFFELKMWLYEYSVTHYRPHKVVHSNMKPRYTIACEDRGCP